MSNFYAILRNDPPSTKDNLSTSGFPNESVSIQYSNSSSCCCCCSNHNSGSLQSSLDQQQHSGSVIHLAARRAMHACLLHRRAEEAYAVYIAACSCGVEGLDMLAASALNQLPMRQTQRTVVAQLCSAHEGSDAPRDLGDDTHRRGNVSAVSEGLLCEAERFRVQTRQQAQLLRSLGLLPKPLGARFVQSRMQVVCDLPQLAADAEVLPLAQLSSAALWHPFSHASPSEESAQRELLYEYLSAPTSRYSTAQQERLSELERTLGPPASSTAGFVAAHAAHWDALLLRRVAETLVLPAEMHDTVPHNGRSGNGRSHARRTMQVPRAGGCKWAGGDDNVGSLFDPPISPAAAGGGTASQKRLEAIVRRRVLHDIVVPDAAFVVANLHQLLHLGRHREIVVTHGVLLELVYMAADVQARARFAARRALRALMERTTSHQKDEASGVTVLGLQDELTLTEDCQERFLLADSWGLWAASLPEMERVAVLSGGAPHLTQAHGLSASLCARQLQRVITSHDHDEDHYGSSQPVSRAGRSLLGENLDIQALAGGMATSVAPLVQSLCMTRSSANWTKAPVMLATTQPSTRTIAFALGVRMFPPVSAAS